ncbi:unnamed protein product [Pseudo-nitzschia multistriata]|uniref:NLE domain-containing protein n=1 Tax=Pseudo-nitzschia multistriata TaxID=183589 RepID=A0A448YUK0_9STRA|nr:unnamed protein product [Pseudo-nitzschia multistriata]
MASSDSDSDVEGPQVRVSLKLSNAVQDRSLEVPIEPIAVPADIGRKGLSAVLNHLLGRSVTSDKKDDDSDEEMSDDDDSDDEKLPPLAFEFIVKGTSNRLLRKGVEKEARQHGLSLEEAISITYFPASDVPYRKDDEETLPDWVSCLSACDGYGDNESSNFVFSGCYDGSIHAYRRNDDSSLTKVDFTTDGTAGPIKAMATIRTDDKVWVASASMDHSLNVYAFESNSKNDKAKLGFHGQCVLAANELGSSSSSFTSLDFSNKNILASGSGNGKISIWNVENIVDNHTTETDKKRQKSSSSKKVKPAASKNEIAATVHFENAHSQSVTGLSWGNHNKTLTDGSDDTVGGTHLISGSWDHSIKLWDVEKHNCLLTLNGARVVSCLDTSYHSEGVVATGHPDCTIRLWDVRVNNTKQNTMLVSDNTFRPSHKAWVSSVKWSRSNAYQLASTSHDGAVKVWDIRSSNPLHTVRTFPKEEKGLSLLWLPALEAKSSEAIYAGGTDCVIKRLEM